MLDRQVDPGQTVAASFQTPTLFTLAEDLTKMKLIVDVDEADIGNVRVGQPARFRVDAYPDRVVRVAGQEVRSTPKTSNGVVTYQTVLTVDNSERLLQPGHDRDGGDHRDAGDRMPCSSRMPRCASRRPRRTAAAGGGFQAAAAAAGQQRRDRSDEDAPPHVWTEVGSELKSVEVETRRRPTAESRYCAAAI